MITCYGCLKAKQKLEDVIISTYPRSGSHFLQHAIKNSSNVFISKTHEEIENKKIISIIRNPIDSITSFCAMKSISGELFTPKNLVFSHKTYGGLDFDTFIKQQEKDYYSFYKYLKNDNKIIFKYEDLLNNIDLVVDNILNKFDIKKNKQVNNEEISNHLLNHYEKIGIDQSYIVTSKKRDNYEEIKELVLKSNINFENLNNIYNLVFKNSINI